jgi:hypothetical protein
LISTIPKETFETLGKLKVLELSKNRLSVVRSQMFPAELIHNLQFLGLSRNPYICSCELMWFRDLFLSDGKLFVSYSSEISRYKQNFGLDQSFVCDNLNINLTMFTMSSQACLLSQETCVLITYTCSLLILSLTTFLLLFAYRWQLRLLLYEAFRGRAADRQWRLQHDHFDYDVFVSYASEDLPWVREHLMPQLEDRLGLRLCIHERDFIPGNNIVDNIAECVGSSKKMLMVFSKHFVRSQWCQFELNYCLSHVLEHDDALILVCVDEVVFCEMTTAMMAVMKTTTYIQWAELDDAVESFWGRLYVALQEILRHENAY